jgi:hypothetical protein
MVLGAPPETSALLAMIAQMAGVDDVLRARARTGMACRAFVTSTYRAVPLSYILGDVDNIMPGRGCSAGTTGRIPTAPMGCSKLRPVAAMRGSLFFPAATSPVMQAI